MTDMLILLDAIKRPRLLINAARIGLADYRRETHLPRHLGGDCPMHGPEALRRLMVLEQEMNERRRARTADYSAARHVGLLIAMMAEARFLRCNDRAGAAEPGRGTQAPAPCPATVS
ncbi:MAG: DUF6477 family protein [Rhodobacteraceae bacterium]|nr:DUF6477 family protein [Paracoccaceae bacterium]